MTVPTTAAYTGPYYPNGVTVSYPFGFKVNAPSEVAFVMIDDDGSEVVFPTTDYTVLISESEQQPGGTLTTQVPIPDSGGKPFFVALDADFTQNTKFEDEGAFNQSILNPTFDAGALRSIWLRARIERALLAPFGEPGLVFPRAVARAGRYLSFDVDGNIFLSNGTGNDAALRQDLVDAAQGASLVSFKSPTAGSRSRSAAAKLDDTVSIMDFYFAADADPHNAALQRAVDAGVPVFIPRGVYVINNVTAANVHIYGPGTLRKKAGTKGAMLSLSGSNRIEGVTLDYDWANALQTAPNYGNATVEQVQGSLDLVGVKFIRSFDSAVYNVGANLYIDSACSFTGGKPHNGLTGGNERPTYYVFCVADAATLNQVINIGGAYFEGSSLAANQLHLNPTGIFVTASAVDGFRFRTVNINGATLIGCTTNAGNGNLTGAIDMYNGADNIVISGVTIRYFTYAGLKIQNSSNFSLVGNTITDGAVPVGAHTPHANGIVTIEKARGSVVEQGFGVIANNIISGCAYSGITNNCDYVVICGNTLKGVSVVAGVATGINNAASFVEISDNVGTDILGVMLLTSGNSVKIVNNSLSSGAGQADTALRFDGNDILIDGNSFASGVLAGSTGIRTNGPASNVRIINNFINRFPYGIDIRNGVGAVDKIVRGLNQFANIGIADYNLAGGVTNATQISTAAW